MKGVLLFSALGLLISIHASGEAVITQDLQVKLEEASPVELIPVNIPMEAQIDRGYLESLVSGKAREEQKEIVAQELKNFTARDQAEVLGYLKEMETTGEVSRIRSLWVNNTVCCNVTPRVIEELARIPGIRAIDLDEERQILPPRELPREGEARSLAWGVVKIRAPEVWALGYTGQGILVSVHDTGVDYNHSDLQNNMWDGGPSFPNHGWDFAYNDNDPMDVYGHGTHCAGTIAGDGAAGCTTGVAPGATIMALKVLNDQGGGQESDVWQSIQFAIDNGVDVMSFSIGWVQVVHPDRATWRTTYENALTAGLIASVAAGNERELPWPAPDNVRTPGDVPPPWLHPDQSLTGGVCGVVTLGATNASDNYANFSSYGPVEWESVAPWNDYPYNPEMGLIDPDIAAPGVDVTSCALGGGYTDMSGTSMATPHAAGAMALVLSVDNTLPPAVVDSILEITALDLGPLGKDNDYGAGRIDVLDAVNAIGGSPGGGIIYVSHIIDDAGQPYPDGTLQPGETVDLIVSLANDSTIPFGDVNASLSIASSWITLIDSLAFFGNLLVGDTVNNSSMPYRLSADPSTPEGIDIPCTLFIVADPSYQVEREFMLTIGHIPAVQELSGGELQVSGCRFNHISPNPFGAGGTTIKFKVQNANCKISLGVYDLSGRLVRTLLDGSSDNPTIQPSNQVKWDGKDDAGNALPSGIYFVRLDLMDHPQLVRKAILLR